MFFDNGGAPIRKQYSLDEFSEDTLDSLGAAFRQSYTETFTASTWRSQELIRENLGKGEVAVGHYSPSRGQEVFITGVNEKITNEDAERQIKESGLPLKVPDEGFTQQGLDIVIERKRNELMRKKQMEDAKGVVAGVGQFTAGMVAQILDPANIAASFVPVVSTSRYAQWIAAQSSGLGRAGVRAGVGAVEGLVGAAILEPAIYLNLQREQADYTLAESLVNVGLGTVLGGGLHMGAGALSDAMKKGSKTITDPKGDMPNALDKADPETRKALLETSVGMEAQGYRVDVNAIAEADPKFKAPAKQTEASSFPETKATGEWFHGTGADFDEFDIAKFGTNEPSGDYVGEAIFFTQSRDSAAKYAEQAGGSIIKSVELDIKKPLIIKDGPPKGYYDGIDPKSVLTNSQIKALESAGMSEAQIKRAALGKMTEAQKAEYAKSKGYDGMIDYDYGQAAVFSGDQVKMKPDSSGAVAPKTPSIETTVKNSFSPENMRGVDKGASDQAEKVLSSTERDVDQELEGVSDLLAEYEKMGMQSADLKLYDQAIAKAEEDAMALRAATLCGLTR